MCQLPKEQIQSSNEQSSALRKKFLDLVGSIAEDDLGNKYILTIQCELDINT
jgi:hypothetical protein